MLTNLRSNNFLACVLCRSNFIDSIEVSNEKSDVTLTVRGCTERHSLCVENTLESWFLLSYFFNLRQICAVLEAFSVTKVI